jgi:hypothetical protein
MAHTGAALELDADYTFERRIYQRDLFEDTNAIRGTAEALWHALPERLDFTVRNTITEATINSGEPNTEANRQSVSYTDIGPTLRLRPRSNGEFQLEYLYTDVNDDETDTDSKRQNGSARYILELSSVRTTTLEATRQDVDFDDPGAPDLETWIGSVTYAQTGGNLQYSLMGGYNRTSRTLGREDVDGGVFAVSMIWDATSNRSLSLEASHGLRDQSSMLLSGGGGFGDEINEDTDLNELFAETLLDVALTQRLGANEFELSVRGTLEDYEDVPRDSDYLAGRLDYERNVSRRTTFRAYVEAGKRNYTNEGSQYKEVLAGMELSRFMSRRFALSLQVLYEKRESEALGILENYDEWVGALTLSYQLIGTPRMAP